MDLHISGRKISSGCGSAEDCRESVRAVGFEGAWSRRERNADPIPANGDHGTPLQIPGMSPQNTLQQEDSLGCRNVGEPDQSAVGSRAMEDQLKEVLVKGDHDSILSGRSFQKVLVTGIGPDHLRDIMSLLAQP